MAGTDLATYQGSYLTPSFEHARVADAMRVGVISCTRDTSLRAVARTLAGYHIHCVVVTDAGGEGAWGVLSDLDLASAAESDIDDASAGSIAATEAVTVRPDEPLARAAQLMVDHQVAHLVVIDSAGRPSGVVSTLDIAGILAWGRG